MPTIDLDKTPLLRFRRIPVDGDVQIKHWNVIEFLELGFEKSGHSEAICDGKPFYIPNDKIEKLLIMSDSGFYKIELPIEPGAN